jgi:hypothetical protein
VQHFQTTGFINKVQGSGYSTTQPIHHDSRAAGEGTPTVTNGAMSGAPGGLLRAAERAGNGAKRMATMMLLLQGKGRTPLGGCAGGIPRRHNGTLPIRTGKESPATARRGLASSSTADLSLLSSLGDRGTRAAESDAAAGPPLLDGGGGGINHPRAADAVVDLSRAVVKARGDLPYGSREYRLLVPTLSSQSRTTLTGSTIDSLVVVARLRAHRNIIFGATVVADAFATPGGFPSTTTTQHHVVPLVPRLVDVCSPLVALALRDAGSQGEQPQAMATLHGLSAWVRSCLQEEDDDSSLVPLLSPQCDSHVLLQLARRQPMTEADRVALEAVRAIATGVPRRRRRSTDSGEGLAVINSSSLEEEDDGGSARAAAAAVLDFGGSGSGGTMRDGRELWIRLAREYAPRSDEVRLYRARGAEVAAIELVGRSRSNNSNSNNKSTSSSKNKKNDDDDDDEYMKSAGGAMARMFFL